MPTHEAKKRVVTYVGADGRSLMFAAKDYLGAAYDLTDLTVTITANYSNVTQINDAAVTVTDDAAGEFEYTPSAAEVDTAGDYDAQVKLVDGSSKVDWLEPVIIEVRTPITPIA